MWVIPASNPTGRACIVVIIVFAVLAVLAFGLRVCSLRLQRVALGASEYICFLGLVSADKHRSASDGRAKFS